MLKELTVTRVVFSCPPNAHGHILKMTAKRYWTSDSDANTEGLSLFFAHCVASHKEQWEPIIPQIFQTQAGKALYHRVREAWAVDWQSHGEAGVLNRDLLSEDGVAAFEWGDAIAAFIRSPHLLGRRIVGIGHSGGARALVLSLRFLPEIPFTSLILIEPTMATPALYARTMAPHIPAIVSATRRKRDTWPSREEAGAWMGAREPWRRWNKTVFALFIEHGLVPTTTGSGDVTLKCDRRHEARGMAHVEPHMSAVEVLGRLGGKVPVHLVWANGSELPLSLFPPLSIIRYTSSFSYYAIRRKANPDARSPRIMQDALSARADVDADGNEKQNGRRFASITRLEGGHRIVQESPDEVARAICHALDSISVTDRGERSRL
ncbi:CN hydrolase domain-containing protein [Mycena sanguinolenta]|uniref:CN hydrolase domain-containing protein n=1 Tax=Mycena sanguinolenta TaxID=230812 RepID=A0A8H7D6A9_9AGAR|nr:CN hydrolase domain-containing protein [Mycena sanguinolenta]